jgi:hypothetical protein
LARKLERRLYEEGERTLALLQLAIEVLGAKLVDVLRLAAKHLWFTNS